MTHRPDGEVKSRSFSLPRLAGAGRRATAEAKDRFVERTAGFRLLQSGTQRPQVRN